MNGQNGFAKIRVKTCVRVVVDRFYNMDQKQKIIEIFLQIARLCSFLYSYLGIVVVWTNKKVFENLVTLSLLKAVPHVTRLSPAVDTARTNWNFLGKQNCVWEDPSPALQIDYWQVICLSSFNNSFHSLLFLYSVSRQLFTYSTTAADGRDLSNNIIHITLSIFCKVVSKNWLRLYIIVPCNLRRKINWKSLYYVFIYCTVCKSVNMANWFILLLLMKMR